MAHAFATVKIKVACKSIWSDDTTMGQIASQAKKDAADQIADALHGRTDMTVIGTPNVTVVQQDIAEK